MSQLDHHKTELIRIAAVVIALLLSWLEVWKFIIGFDFIALAATIIGGYPMFEEAWEAIKERRMTMELSMAIAVVATLFIGQFFTGLVITFFVLFAELLEHLTVESGRNVIGKLLESLPRQAIVRSNNQEKTVEISELKLNDVVIIKPGTKISIDGIVVKGNSSVDQSSITGESLPIEKLTGHKVFAGTINQTGVLEVRTEHIGNDTTFGKIIHIIEEAEKSKAPIQKIADKLSGRLVYFAFAGAIATFLFTHNIVSAIAALIVAGACGVAAGTPLAILAGIGRAAREGIIAANAEQHSEHPLANAILRKVKDLNLLSKSYGDIKYFPGQGIVCRTNGDEVLVGNASLMDKESVKFDPAVTQYFSEIKSKGETGVIVVKNREIVGIIGIADILRTKAKQPVSEFKKLGTRVILLTGDSINTAKTIGETLQVDEVFGEMLPEQKSEKIQELIKNGKKVAMVGDGINDAPALVEATVGIAMGTGTDVALESADMALMTTDLMKIVEAIKISRQSLRVIMFNFWGTIIVDVTGVALAFFGYLTPLFGALIHVGSELAFILNSTRLFRKEGKNL